MKTLARPTASKMSLAQQKTRTSTWVESTVRKVLGFSESSVARTALGCMEKGFDKRKTKATLVDLLDERVADRWW